LALKVVITGPRGKMGSKVFQTLKNKDGYHIVALIDHKPEKWNEKKLSVPVFADIQSCFLETKPDVLIDFTNPTASYQFIKIAIEHQVKVISGTTGFTDEILLEINQLADQKEIGCVIAPNFALGAVLMMVFTQYAAKFFQDIALIEKHHKQKLDIPSGTADLLKRLIIEENKEINIDIKSIRAEGYIAHHEVIFGAPGQVLTLKHDSHDRKSFIHGLKLTLKEIKHIQHFIFGLENVLRI